MTSYNKVGSGPPVLAGGARAGKPARKAAPLSVSRPRADGALLSRAPCPLCASGRASARPGWTSLEEQSGGSCGAHPKPTCPRPPVLSAGGLPNPPVQGRHSGDNGCQSWLQGGIGIPSLSSAAGEHEVLFSAQRISGSSKKTRRHFGSWFGGPSSVSLSHQVLWVLH